MSTKLDVKKCLERYLAESADVQEFLFFCIARQGGRTALEILARALIGQGKHVFVGQNLTGLRSMGTNHMVMRISDKPDIPQGMTAERPAGIMFMHEALVWPDPTEVVAQIKRSESILKTRKGLLMICTSSAPEAVEYPVDFEGTVATVDAEAIFARHVDIRPAPSGITSLGLFAAASDVVSIEALKEAVMKHDRLGPKLRQINAECMENAYERAKVVHGLKLKGRMTPEAFKETIQSRPSTTLLDTDQKSVSTTWREELPILDPSLCACRVCFSAMACPESVITWKDGAIHMDYDFCKGCGSCAFECPSSALAMEDAALVLEKRNQSRSG